MKIERHIPLPTPPESAKSRGERIPVEQMEIGDSLFFKDRNRVSACGGCKATAMKAGLKMNFKSAREGDGVRVWRIA